MLEGNGRKPGIYDEECRGVPVDISFINALGSVGSLAIPGESAFKKVGGIFFSMDIGGAFDANSETGVPKRKQERSNQNVGGTAPG